MEERERGSRKKAELLAGEFQGRFRSMGYTLHPGGVEGEAVGKSSNLGWCLRRAWDELREEGKSGESVVVSVLDSDSESSFCETLGSRVGGRREDEANLGCSRSCRGLLCGGELQVCFEVEGRAVSLSWLEVVSCMARSGAPGGLSLLLSLPCSLLLSLLLPDRREKSLSTIAERGGYHLHRSGKVSSVSPEGESSHLHL